MVHLHPRQQDRARCLSRTGLTTATPTSRGRLLARPGVDCRVGNFKVLQGGVQFAQVPAGIHSQSDLGGDRQPLQTEKPSPRQRELGAADILGRTFWSPRSVDESLPIPDLKPIKSDGILLGQLNSLPKQIII
jgi:hypothetical protein